METARRKKVYHTSPCFAMCLKSTPQEMLHLIVLLSGQSETLSITIGWMVCVEWRSPTTKQHGPIPICRYAHGLTFLTPKRTDISMLAGSVANSTIQITRFTHIAIFWSFCFHQPSLRFRLDEWLNKQWHLTSLWQLDLSTCRARIQRAVQRQGGSEHPSSVALGQCQTHRAAT